jgi:tRNA modification GTPase
VLEVIDASRPPGGAARVELPEEAPRHLVVLNKSDLGEDPGWRGCADAVRLSCTSGTGFDELVARVTAELAAGPADAACADIAINARHQACLATAGEALAAAAGLLAAAQPPELVAEELRAALAALADITGKTDAEEILGAIFGRFCIGK